MDSKKVARVANDIRALEAQTKAMQVGASNLQRAINSAMRDLDENDHPPINTDSVRSLINATGMALETLHEQMNIAAEALCIEVPDDDDDDIIIPLGGGGTK